MNEALKHAVNPTSRRGQEPPFRAPPEPSPLKDILFLLAKIAVILVAFLLIFTFMYGLCRNTDASMAPSVKDGDLVIFYRLDKKYVAQDTLVLEFEGQMQVRRVIATAGDVVDITEDGLVINGALQQETGIYESTQRYENGVEFPLTVGEGQVFVLADSRVNVADSRIYGAVEIKDTLGKVMTIFRRRNI
ncbi:signal peptidase I [Desulforamulus aeronauticus]|uniref:Signal peptidase I n=1 Tax=Desulforamulus aeronauticus DSM 10349 TaxID=1121421 RepID=A0A1M6VT13_9FIRM|nr:signal peptidase I [Desulforamulus aeronauticus]SHK84653.1 signal peptidase I [Desulforamulus aeronauticus DSM 10349]